MDSYTFFDLITFTRTTNATLVDGIGNVTYAPNNLFTNSEAFDASSWTKDTSTITANVTVAPDGTTTADKAIPNNGADLTSIANGAVRQAVTFPAGATLVFSVFAKEAEFDRIELYFSEGTGTTNRATVTYSLVDGSVVTAAAVAGTFTNVSSTSTSVGNGWYRLTLTFTSGTATSARARFAVRDSGTTTGDGTSGIFIWGAQLEQVTYQTTAGTYNSTSPANLFGFTEEFDNAGWTKTNSTITANATTAPDGTLTGDKHIPDLAAILGTGATQTRVQQSPSATSGTSYTFTIYAKAGEFDRIEFALIATPSVSALFSLTSGTVVSGTGASITPAGNGWYRCAFTATAGATGALAIRWTAQSSTVSVGDGTSGIFVWGAQLSNSASVDPYVYNPGAAPTSTAYYGPRFDYNPATLAPLGLLIEEQRVNLLLYSDQFDNAGWTKAGATITANATTSPDGTANADKLVENTALAQHRVQQAVTTVIGTSYTHTIYLKAGERTSATLRVIGAATFAGCTINLTAGTISGVTGVGTITNAGNGWYRVSVTGTADSTTSTCYVNLADAGNNTYTGDGTSGLFLYGAQIEAGSFATSYIPTVASTVTRAADIAVMSGSNFSSWYNQSQGTMVAFFNTTTAITSVSLGAFGVSDGTSNERLSIRRNSSDTNPTFFVVDGGVAQYNQSVTAASGPYRSALAYANGDYRGANNGTLATAGTGTVPTVTQAELGFSQLLTRLNGHLQSITYYPYRLADFQLQALTS